MALSLPPCLIAVLSLVALAGCPGPAAPVVGKRAPLKVAAPVEASPPAPLQPRPVVLDEVATTAVLRAHLLHLLPCDHSHEGGEPSKEASASLRVLLTLRADGTLLALRAEPENLSPRAVRCALARVAYWAFPTQPRAAQTEIQLNISFPLRAPSINDNAAVLVPGPGLIDVPAATSELRRLRERVLGCYHVPPVGDAEPRLLLVSLRLGEFGRLLSSSVDVDTGNRFRAAPQTEQACVHKALRQGHFPNPQGGEVELRFPYVLSP